MKMSKKALEARKKVIDTYPAAEIHKYWTRNNEGRFGVFVRYAEPKTSFDAYYGKTISNGFWLELEKDNSSTKEKAWIDAYKAMLRDFLSMLESL
jgi:hypothetical protein